MDNRIKSLIKKTLCNHLLEVDGIIREYKVWCDDITSEAYCDYIFKHLPVNKRLYKFNSVYITGLAEGDCRELIPVIRIL